MDKYDFREELKSIFAEASKNNYPEFVLNSDLDRLIRSFESDVIRRTEDSIESDRRAQESCW